MVYCLLISAFNTCCCKLYLYHDTHFCYLRKIDCSSKVTDLVWLYRLHSKPHTGNDLTHVNGDIYIILAYIAINERQYNFDHGGPSKWYRRDKVFGITFIRYAQCQYIWKPNNLTVFGSKKPKVFRQDRNICIHRTTEINITWKSLKIPKG